MANKKFFFFINLVLVLAVFSCQKENNVSTPISEKKQIEGEKYILDTENSQVEWKGFKVFKDENTSHFGILKMKRGAVLVKNNQLIGGEIVADMQSIENLDLQEEPLRKEKLEKHLLSNDFFQVKNFPEAVFQITKVIPHDGDYSHLLVGNLKIKNTTKPLEILANVQIQDGEITIATIPKDILRESFGVAFQSPIENGVILNEINIQAFIKAKK